ncbi:MAG: hypothetical protein EOP51_29300, partial [Sphingobacteriales bacterium]
MQKALFVLLVFVFYGTVHAQPKWPAKPNLAKAKGYNQRVDLWKAFLYDVVDSAYSSTSGISMKDFIATARQGHDLLRQTDTATKAFFNYYMGAGFQAASKYDSAIVYLEKALWAYRKLKIYKEEIKVICVLHYAYYYAGQGQRRDTMMVYLRKMLPQIKDDYPLKTRMISTLSEYAYDHAEYEKAIAYKLQVIALTKEAQAKKKESIGPSDVAVAYHQIAETYLVIKQYEKALYYLKAAQPYLINNYHATANALLSTIAAYQGLNNEQDALLSFKELQKHVKGKEIAPFTLSAANRSFADYYLGKGKLDMAEKYALKALRYAANISGQEHKQNAVDAKMTLGFVLYRQGKYAQAVNYLGGVIASSYEFGRERYATGNQMLAESYAALGKHDQAFKHYQVYARLQDTLYRESSKKSIAEMDAKYNRQANAREIKLLNAENTTK